MLLQTLKSRNIWLWGESYYYPSTTTAEEDLKAEMQDIKKQQIDYQIQATNALNLYKETGDETYLTQANDLNEVIATYEMTYQELNTQLKNKNYTVTAETVTHVYTKPFKLTAPQALDTVWDHAVGESIGLTTNFLQAWHVKPVNITITGLSYFGAYGGYVVDAAATYDQQTEIENGTSTLTTTDSLSSTLSTYTTTASTALASFANSIDNDSTAENYKNVLDEDIAKLKTIISLYGEGPNISKASTGASWVYLLVENEPGAVIKDSYVTFIGHLKHLRYEESVDAPFIYKYTVQFVGIPTLTQAIGDAQIQAKEDANNLKFSLITTSSGFGLSYAF